MIFSLRAPKFADGDPLDVDRVECSQLINGVKRLEIQNFRANKT